MLVKTKEDPTQYCNANKVAMNNPNAYMTKKQDYVILPTNTIIDGVEIGAKGSLVHKALPNNIDRGAVLLSLIHISEPTRLHKVSRMPSSA